MNYREFATLTFNADPYDDAEIAAIYEWNIQATYPYRLRMPIALKAYLYENGNYQYGYREIGSVHLKYTPVNDGKHPDQFRETAIITIKETTKEKDIS